MEEATWADSEKRSGQSIPRKSEAAPRDHENLALAKKYGSRLQLRLWRTLPTSQLRRKESHSRQMRNRVSGTSRTPLADPKRSKSHWARRTSRKAKRVLTLRPLHQTRIRTRAMARRGRTRSRSATSTTKMEHRVGPADSPEAIEPLATFSSTAMDTKKFQIEVRAFEEKTGIDLGEKGKTLAISGEIEGVGKFRKIHTCGSKGEYFPIYPPKDWRDSIVAGDKYKVNVRSVEEVSRSADKLGTFYLSLFREDDGELRFDLTRSSFEKRSGMKLKDGQTYDFKVRIGESYSFETKHAVSEDNSHIFIRVPRERAYEFKLGEKHEVTILSVTERHALATVPKSEVRTKLLLGKGMLKSLGVDVESLKNAKESDRLLDVTLRKIAPRGDESTRRVFGKFEPQRSVLLLNIADIGGKQGDTYEILRANELTMKKFLSDFNANRGKGFGNMSLNLEGGKLVLNVDQRGFEAKSYSFDANRLRAFLRAEFGPYKKEFSFWFDGQTVFAKYAMGKPIIAFSTSEEGFEMTHPAIRQDFTALQSTGVLQKDSAERPRTLQTLKLIEDKREIEGSHRFATDEALRSSMASSLQQAYLRSEMKGKLERGDIGEDVVSIVFSKRNWKEIVRHPFSSIGIGRGSEKRGTDVLFSDSNGDLYLVEAKWWKNSKTALKEGARDLEERRAKEEDDETWGKIRGAYIAAIDYDLRNAEGVLHVKRVW